ncbi:MAG: S1 RNA-binding domain-containing protein [Oscillospiraceae bacterium]|jgi:S1 RNA binding domain protein|nr:S1 RNA-binding domain-containing protein [Oscillospiraceae bacterium]
MQPIVGEIFEGKVTGITKFGAFVSLPDGNNGLVHISEIANSYVNDVHDHVSDGQTVKVKVIGISEAGKINLSMKKAEAPAPRAEAERLPKPRPFPARPKEFSGRQNGFAQKSFSQSVSSEPSFEDKLKQFMQESDSRISDSRIYSDKKSGYRRKRD